VRPEQLENPGAHSRPAFESQERTVPFQGGHADDVGIEHGHELGEITTGAGGDEPLGQGALPGDLHVGVAGELTVANRSAGPAGQLAAGGGAPAHDVADRLEREAEDVVQHESRPLGRREPIEHHGEGELDLVVEGDPVGRVTALPAQHWRVDVGEPTGGGLEPGVRRVQMVEAQPPDDDHQPAP
jgi:hypothetical protein